LGHVTRLHGYIFNWLRHEEDNRARLAALPETEEDAAPLTRDMFASAGLSYDAAQFIAFARGYNGVEQHWVEWRAKFEALLRTMYWNEAHVYLETEQWGIYHFWWERRWLDENYDDRQSEEAGRDEEDRPTTEWEYHGMVHNLYH
jgi:hypothetical protein